MDKKRISDSIVFTIFSSFFAVMAIIVFLADILSGTRDFTIIKMGTTSLVAFILVLVKKLFDIGNENSKGHISLFTIVSTVVVFAVIVILCLL